MPFKIDYYKDHSLYHVNWGGDMTPESVQQFYEEIAGEKWFRRGLDGLQDLRGATVALSRSDHPELSELERTKGSIFGPGRVANVVDSLRAKSLVTAICSVMGSEDRNWRVFMDMDEAKTWLGVPLDLVLD
jgi:hypothetical protein